ncbi:aminopeptidase P family protein [bacterium]|nr:aminopeptidase P family protein [bacterium]
MNSACKKLAEALVKENIEGMIITSAANIRYFSGFASEDGWVFVGRGGAALITDGRYWDDVTAKLPDVELVKYVAARDGSLNLCLAGWLRSKGVSGSIAFEGDTISLADFHSIERLLMAGVVKDLINKSDLISDLRLIKTEAELRGIAKAAAAADAAWRRALPAFKEGVSEADFCAELEYCMQKCGARKPSFDTIVASGINGAYPHATVTDKVIKRGELVTVDFGCIVDGWCSDITRTVWLGDLDEKSLKIWQTVRRAHDTALESVKAGIGCADLDKIARDIIAEAGFGEYFNHSLGHGVGLAVHERPGLRNTSEEILAPGMTATIEPGIYIPGFSGCRIEDLVYVKADGYERLSRAPYQIPGQAHPLEAYK